jgi:hypothetical protein
MGKGLLGLAEHFIKHTGCRSRSGVAGPKRDGRELI